MPLRRGQELAIFSIRMQEINCGYALLVCVAGALAVQAKEEIFTFEQLVEKAAILANAPYQEWCHIQPDAKRKMTYDQYRNIRFNPKKAVWYYDHIPFQAQLFHRDGFRTTRWTST